MRESLKEGNVSLENLYTALPFGHHVNKITLTGAQIKLALEQQWRIGQENDMLQAVGITYSYDLNAPIGKRIVELKDMNGHDLQPTKEYEVAISDYLADGGDEFTAFKQGRSVEPGPLVVDVLSNYLKQNYPNVVIPH
jgi:5'-nucleotidase